MSRKYIKMSKYLHYHLQYHACCTIKVTSTYHYQEKKEILIVSQKNMQSSTFEIHSSPFRFLDCAGGSSLPPCLTNTSLSITDLKKYHYCSGRSE